MRVLIVDENADFRLVLAEVLREGYEGGVVAARRAGAALPQPLHIREWDPVAGGLPMPGDDFELDCNVILIDSNIEPDDPVEWLTGLKVQFRRLPPVVMLTSGRDADGLIVKAVKLGVVGCLPRLELTPARLYDELADAMLEREQALTIETSLRTGVYTPIPPPMLSPAGDVDMPSIPGYAIDDLIGEGGTARVYLARRDSDGLQVVLKVLLPELMGKTRVVKRFMQEFSLVQKIQSVYVTRIFDLNYDRGMAYLAMEYFGAGDLRERIRTGFTAIKAIKLFAQIARALVAIHDAGIVHRDLKPHNIMFRDQNHLAIVDFGGAKALGEESGITKVGQVVGTPNYMSPEQVMGLPLDTRSDLYSLGVILHLLLTGRTLYQGRDAADIMDMHVNAPIPRLPDHLSGFQTLLSRLVAKKPEDRFESAHELYAHIVA